MGSTELQPASAGFTGNLPFSTPLELPLCEEAPFRTRIKPDKAIRPCPGSKPLLSAKDFVVPELVSRGENGDLSVSIGSATDEAQIRQVFRLAESASESVSEYSSLSHADQQLERRRYLDYLKRKPKRELDRLVRVQELEVWQLGGPEAEANFLAWWSRKQQRRQAAFARKANRLANCGVSGRRMDCSDHPDEHRFFAEFQCQCRYCRRCGAQIFGQLFGKYVGLWPTVSGLLPKPGNRAAVVIAKLDVTTKNLERMPTAQEIREFNQDVRECLKRVLRELGIGSGQYGFLWCDEFGGWDDKKGSYNTNLHAHGVYVGPYLPQPLLAEAWAAIREKKDGAKIVWISKQRISGPPQNYLECERHRFIRALGHALKYTGKHVSRSDGERLAELEIAFHTVRRVHTMGLFYHAKLTCDSSCVHCGATCELVHGHLGDCRCKSCRHGNRCPLCLARLMFPRDSGYAAVADLKKEGRKELGEVRRKIGRDLVLYGPRGPDQSAGFQEKAA